jgi:hypothetical protein
VLNGVDGDTYLGVAVIRHYRMAAVSIADAAREVAAGDVDLNPVPGAEGV